MLPVPVYFTIENPDVVSACTVEVIEPLVFELVVPPFAFQFHPTKLSLLVLTWSKLPNVKPSLVKEVNPSDSVVSAEVLSDSICLVTPLLESYKLWLSEASLFFIHVKSGLNSNPVIVLPPEPIAVPLPW